MGEQRLRATHGFGAHRQWIPVFNSQAAVYGGWAGSGTHGELWSDEAERLWINVPKWSVLLFELH